MWLHAARVGNVGRLRGMESAIAIESTTDNKCVQVMNTPFELLSANRRPNGSSQETAVTNDDRRTPLRIVDEEAGVDGAQERRPVWLRVRDALSRIFWERSMLSKKRPLVRPLDTEQESGGLLRSAEGAAADERTIDVNAMRLQMFSKLRSIEGRHLFPHS